MTIAQYSTSEWESTLIPSITKLMHTARREWKNKKLDTNGKRPKICIIGGLERKKGEIVAKAINRWWLRKFPNVLEIHLQTQ